MVKRNSFTKFMLIVCGIVLMTAVFSGCTDADAPDTFFTEEGLQKILDDDTPLDYDLEDQIKTYGFIPEVVLNEKTSEIDSILITDDGIKVRLINDDSDKFIDRITLDGVEIYPTKETAEATSTQTQLADATTGSNELYKELLSQDDPEAFKQLLGMDINTLTIKGLGTPDEGSLEAKANGERTTLEWDADYNEKLEPKTGLEKYKETHDGSLNGLLFKTDNNGFSVSDKIGNDGKIDMVKGRINGQTFEYISE